MYSLLNFKFIGYLILASTFLASCSSTAQKSDESNYFNLHDYLNQEIKSLAKTTRQLKKTISINGESETKTLNQIDFSKELEPFREGDINKSSWDGSFLLDTNEHSITYHRTSEKIPVKSLQIFKTLNVIDSVKIVIERDNILYHTIDSLKYTSGKGYEIKKYQKVILLPEKKYLINCYFE